MMTKLKPRALLLALLLLPRAALGDVAVFGACR